VIVAVAPHLHGLAVPVLDDAVEAVCAHAEAIPLPAVRGARETVWAAACVLADEERVAELAVSLAEQEGPQVSYLDAGEAVGSVQERLAGPFTASQRAVAVGVLTSGHGLDLVVGIAGSGKTTTLRAVRAGFEAAGYQVIGAATSGQAAKTLGEGAGMASRTVASLAWRLDHGQLTLTGRHVVVLDEAGMTDDADLARLAGAVVRAKAKMIVVGDDRQLSPVGPGGALGALVERHPANVWRLTDNLRQVEAAERVALEELRCGQVAAAVGWYADQDRIHAGRDTLRAVAAMVDRWAEDVAKDREVVMLAYRRESVETLNRAARAVWEQMGRLSGPELVAPGGSAYRAGDRIITVAPGPRGAWVTSQAATVVAVEPPDQRIRAVTPDGQRLSLGPDEIGAEKLAHGYAVTAHRSQGTTVEVAHVLADGGGRELAYVAMSRARQQSHVYVVAPDPAQAADRLVWAWDQQRRQIWITEADRAERIAQLEKERYLLVRSIPPDVTERLVETQSRRAAVERSLADLHAGAGHWADTEFGDAAVRLAEARRVQQEAAEHAAAGHLGLWARRRARQAEQTAAVLLEQANVHWNVVAGPQAHQMKAEHNLLARDIERLKQTQQARSVYLAAHPDLPQQIARLDQLIADAQRLQAPSPTPPMPSLALTSGPELRHQIETLRAHEYARALPVQEIRGPSISA
jgi:hypothetical protein